MFINFTNHPSCNWDKEQLICANQYGSILDIAFPDVDPKYTKQDILLLAKQYVDKIVSYKPKAVLVQGEMSLCYNVVKLLKELDMFVLCACSNRESIETIDEDGRTIKNSIFVFSGFREY